MTSLIRRLEMEKADYAETVADRNGRLHDFVDEILDLRLKLVRSSLGLACVFPGPCVVKEVFPGSAAERAGIEVGDVVLRMNGEAVPDEGHLQEVLPRYFGQDQVKIELQRGSQLIVVSADLQPRNARRP